MAPTFTLMGIAYYLPTLILQPTLQHIVDIFGQTTQFICLNSTIVAPATCSVADTVTWNQTPVTDSSQVIVQRPTTAPSASGTQATFLFQADGNHSTLMWIHFTLTSNNLKNQSGVAITRDVVAAVNLRN